MGLRMRILLDINWVVQSIPCFNTGYQLISDKTVEIISFLLLHRRVGTNRGKLLGTTSTKKDDKEN